MRLFFAIDLPADLKAGVAAARDALALDPVLWRPVRPEALHLTLRFMGEVGPERLSTLASIGRAVAAPYPPIPCALGAIGAFPRASRARVLWIGLHDRSAAGDLARVVGALEERLRDEGFPPEDRAFAPHLTIARAKRPARAPSIPSGGPEGTFVACELLLLQSHLGPPGSRYELVGTFPLCQDARGGET